MLPKSLFSGNDTISESDKKKIFVNNFSDNIETVLGEFEWDGKAAATIGLTLSSDNRKVESGRFMTRGKLVEKSILVKACDIWEDANENVVLTIKLPRAEIFKFVDGGLYSQYVNEETVNHYFHNIVAGSAPVPIPAQEKEEWQIGSFCLRQICYISKASTARGGVMITYVVLIFPTSKEQLLQGSELTANPSWPGLKLCSGEMLLLPKPSTTWKCPVLPLIRASTEDGNIPSGTALRHAIGAILSKAGCADVAKDVQALLIKWEHLAENPQDFCQKPTPMDWPKQPAPEPETGKRKSKMYVYVGFDRINSTERVHLSRLCYYRIKSI